MTSRFKLMASVSLALITAGHACAFSFPRLSKPRASTPAAAPAATPAARRAPGEWPQARSDLAPDPAIRFGALANGMRYEILRTAAPAGAVSMRLRIAAGSLIETDEEAGYARLLEHLAFDGSKAVSAGERVEFLKHHGVTFGPDTNGAVAFDATTYTLDLAKADDDATDTALMLLRETASELTLDDGAVERERGVALAELNAGDTAPWRVFKARLAFLLDGQRPPQRFAIGKVDTIQGATREKIAAFYARGYRPERATLVITGDCDPAAIEGKIRARFADWTPRGPAGAEPETGPVATRGLQTRLAIEPGAPTSLELAWTSPPDLSADTRARRRRELVERLAMAVLNRRLTDAAAVDDPPFLSAGAFRDNELGAARVTGLIAATEAGAWQKALAAIDQEQRRAVTYGVRPDELARQIGELESSLKEAVAQTSSRPAAAVADELTAAAADDEVETNPVQDLAFFEEIARGLTADEVSRVLKTAFVASGPLIFLSSPDPIQGGEAAVQAAYLASRGQAVDAPAITAATAWPYGDFGNPSKVASQKEISDLDTVLITFANGVRLTVKPTKFTPDEVMVEVRGGSGLRALPPDHPTTVWSTRAMIEGGLGKISLEDAGRALAPAVYGAQARAEDDAFSLSGVTRRDDLDTQLQVLAAYLTDPGWRPEAVERARAAETSERGEAVKTAAGVVAGELPGLLRAGDRRWAQPGREEIAGAGLADLKTQVEAMQSGPVEVVVVGDITVDKAIDAVARTFGALPARQPPPLLPPASVAFPATGGPPTVISHAGPADQAIGLVAWRTDGLFVDPRLARTASLLADVIQLRLADSRGTAGGPTGSVSADSQASAVWPHWGYLGVRIETTPDQLDGFFAQVSRTSADLEDHDVQAAELARAIKLRLEAIARARATNAFWLAALSGAQDDLRRLDAIRSEQGGYESITPADLRRAAQKYLGDDRAWRLEVKPARAPPQ